MSSLISKYSAKMHAEEQQFGGKILILHESGPFFSRQGSSDLSFGLAPPAPLPRRSAVILHSKRELPQCTMGTTAVHAANGKFPLSAHVVTIAVSVSAVSIRWPWKAEASHCFAAKKFAFSEEKLQDPKSTSDQTSAA